MPISNKNNYCIKIEKQAAGQPLEEYILKVLFKIMPIY